MTKYIVNDVANQSITGDLRINGDLKVSDGTYSISTYRALLTQTATFSAQNLNQMLLGAFIIGESYEITDYVAGDDFSNIANVYGGSLNQTGCQFVATGELPNVWDNSSTIVSAGNFVVQVLENNLGFDILWFDDFVSGVYFGLNATTGPIHNSFPRNQVSVITSQTVDPFNMPLMVSQFGQVASIGGKDDVVVVAAFDFDAGQNLVDYLYYTPVQISFKQSLDTTPILATGSISESFPFSNVTLDIFAGPRYIETFDPDSNATVNNIDELVNLLNTDPVTSFLGTFGYDESENILLTIPTNIKEQFSPNNVLTFEVYVT